MVVADHHVGRVEELRLLEHLLDEIDRRHGRLIETVGEPGIGKTRLLRELAERAEGRGHLVLTGSASELERDLPFSVFVNAADEYVGGLEPDRFTLDESVLRELAQVFPTLSGLAADHELALPQERYRSHRAVRALLEQLAAPAPLVLVLDDFHWADSASIELLWALLRRPPAAAVLIALSRRPRQTPERLLTALERADREGVLTRIELGALSPDETRDFLGEEFDAVQSAILYEETGGNPFYLEQLARSFQPSGDSVSEAVELGSAIEVPLAIAAALAEELSSVSPRARVILKGAAVAGDPFEVELAAAAAGTSESLTLDAIDELLGLDVIRETEVPRRFRFRHPLLRRAMYETIQGGWRLGAHQRCAEFMAAHGASAMTRAHHIERSARHGDLEAAAVLREAGEAAARLAPSSAARWFGAALRLLPETAHEEQVGLLFARASSLAAIGRYAESRLDLLDCIRQVPRGAEDARRVRIITACAVVEQLLGLQTEAHHHLTSALNDLGPEESSEAAELMIELAVNAFHAGDFDSMCDWARRAVASVAFMDGGPLSAAALTVRAWAEALAGAGQQAQIYCDEATNLIEGLSEEELATRLDALAHLANADFYLDRFQAATRHAQRALDIGRATGQGKVFPNMVAILGGSLWVQGKILESGEVFDGAIEAARISGNLQSLAWSLFNRSYAALAAGDVDLALATARESFELEETMTPGVLSALAGCVYAAALLEVGQANRSVDLLLTSAGGEELRHVGGGWRARFLELLTRALLATGRRGEAASVVAAAQVCAEEVALPSAIAMASLATAALALDAGDPTTAADSAMAAVAALESVHAVFDEARARAFAGQAYALAGHRDRASSELGRAAAAFESFGALRYRDQTERDLRRLGFQIHRRTRSGKVGELGVESLTGRELQVVKLVIDRRTNREIAAELFISQKTVESHLRNIFHKMNVSSRVELARAIDQSDRLANHPLVDVRTAAAKVEEVEIP